jgi:excisionase family DNA binding protein
MTVTPLHRGRASGEALRPARAVYTVPEVAALLDVAVSTAYAMVRAGEIPAKRMGTRWVIPMRRFHDWLDGPAADPTVAMPEVGGER